MQDKVYYQFKLSYNYNIVNVYIFSLIISYLIFLTLEWLEGKRNIKIL